MRQKSNVFSAILEQGVYVRLILGLFEIFGFLKEFAY